MTTQDTLETGGAAGNATGQSATVETPSPANASTAAQTITEADVKAAVEKARREAQAEKDREMARLHREYQERLRQAEAAARRKADAVAQAVSNKADPHQALQLADVFEKAQWADAEMQRRAQEEQWRAFVAGAATAAGLDPGDPRIAGAVSAEDLAAKIAKAVRADERAAAEAERRKQAEQEKARLQARADNGDLDTVGGAPAGAASLQAEYDRRRKAIRRGDVMGLTKLNQEFRRRGLKV